MELFWFLATRYGNKLKYYKAHLCKPCLCTDFYKVFFKPVKHYRAHWCQTLKSRRKKYGFILQIQKKEGKNDYP